MEQSAISQTSLPQRSRRAQRKRKFLFSVFLCGLCVLCGGLTADAKRFPLDDIRPETV